MAHRGFRLLLLASFPLAALAAAGGRPAHADWLVTRGGDRIETRGPWQEKGKLVVFSRPDGTLSSLRLSEVDLAASKAATQQAREAKAQPPAQEAAAKPKRPSVASLTDKDFQRSAPVPAAEPSKEEKKDEKDKAADKKPAVAVASWERGKAPDDGHVIVTGTLRNSGTDQTAAAGVLVRLFDETGTSVGQAEAVLTSTVIPGGGTVGFRADFPGLFTFAAAKFETKGMSLGAKPSAPAAIPTIKP